MPRRFGAALLAGLLLAAGPAAPAPPGPGPAEQLIAMSGGVYRDPALARYLRAVGARLVAAAGFDVPEGYRVLSDERGVRIVPAE